MVPGRLAIDDRAESIRTKRCCARRVSAKRRFSLRYALPRYCTPLQCYSTRSASLLLEPVNTIIPSVWPRLEEHVFIMRRAGMSA